MKRGSAFRITRSSVIAERIIARTALMVSSLTGALIWMARNPKLLFLARTGHANCRKPLPNLTGFCVYICEQGVPREQPSLGPILDTLKAIAITGVFGRAYEQQKSKIMHYCQKGIKRGSVTPAFRSQNQRSAVTVKKVPNAPFQGSVPGAACAPGNRFWAGILVGSGRNGVSIYRERLW